MKIISISKNTATLLVTIFYLLAIAVQLFVIFKIVPYNWVNGGMADSYEAQVIQSVVSIAIIGILYIFVLNIAKTSAVIKSWKSNLLYVITLFWILGLLMQIAGTTFERYILSLLLLLGVVSHVFLIAKVRSDTANK